MAPDDAESAPPAAEAAPASVDLNDFEAYDYTQSEFDASSGLAPPPDADDDDAPSPRPLDEQLAQDDSASADPQAIDDAPADEQALAPVETEARDADPVD